MPEKKPELIEPRATSKEGRVRQILRVAKDTGLHLNRRQALSMEGEKLTEQELEVMSGTGLTLQEVRQALVSLRAKGLIEEVPLQ